MASVRGRQYEAAMVQHGRWRRWEHESYENSLWKIATVRESKLSIDTTSSG